MAPKSDLAEPARRPARRRPAAVAVAGRRSTRRAGRVPRRPGVVAGHPVGVGAAAARPALDAGSLAAALAAVLAGILATFLCWRAVLGDLGGRLPVVAGARVFFLGQLGKYLPGSVWPVIAQMELGRDYGVPERASGAAVGAFLLVVVGTGLAVAAVTAPLLGPDALHSYWWLLAVLPVALVAIVPPVLNRLLGVASGWPGPPLPATLSVGGVSGLRAGRWCPGWPTVSTSGCWPPARGRRPTPPGQGHGGIRGRLVRRLPAAGRPAGAGVREAALVLLLGGVLTRPEGTVVAVVSRLLFVLADLGWCAVRCWRYAPPLALAAGQHSPDGRPGNGLVTSGPRRPGRRSGQAPP